MKTLNKFFIALVITLSFTSCKKSIIDQSIENTIDILSNKEDYEFIKVDTVIEKEFNGNDHIFVISTVEHKSFDGTKKKYLFLTQSIGINTDIARNNLKHEDEEDIERSKRTEVYTILEASGDISDINRHLIGIYGRGIGFQLKLD